MIAAPGEFDKIEKLSNFEVPYLKDAYEAITISNKWNDLKNCTVESFMFHPPAFVSEIHKNMKLLDGHSGASYGYTMRIMEFIAKNGWEAFKNSFQN